MRKFQGRHDALAEALHDARAERSRAGTSYVHAFRRRALRQLLTPQDGRRLAVDVLRALLETGTERCRCNVPNQAEHLVAALLVLKERGSYQSLISFGAILTDALGARCYAPDPALYEAIAQEIPPFKLKRLRRLAEVGLWSAAVAAET